jgi:hypothetical protein
MDSIYMDVLSHEAEGFVFRLRRLQLSEANPKELWSRRHVATLKSSLSVKFLVVIPPKRSQCITEYYLLHACMFEILHLGRFINSIYKIKANQIFHRCKTIWRLQQNIKVSSKLKIYSKFRRIKPWFCVTCLELLSLSPGYGVLCRMYKNLDINF